MLEKIIIRIFGDDKSIQCFVNLYPVCATPIVIGHFSNLEEAIKLAYGVCKANGDDVKLIKIEFYPE